jgi:hypothetical protein
MALQNTRLTELAFIASSVASVYANPSSTKSLVKGLMLHNTNTTSETINVHWVPDASGSLGTAAAGNRFLSIVLSTNETLFVEFPFCIVMTDTNEAIFASTTTASKVTIAVIGDKDV